VHSIDPRYPDLPYRCRQQYHAMVMVMDEMVGNITAAFKAKGMWERTLMVMSSEYVPPFHSLLFVESDSRRLTRRLLCSNGGPVDLAENAANNWPKRGGKYGPLLTQRG